MNNIRLIAAAVTAACAFHAAHAQTAPKPAEPATVEANEAFSKTLPWQDKRAFDDARRGFVAAIPGGRIDGKGPMPVWNMGAYAFLDKDKAADTVNPSLWRQAQLNAIHGLFKVSDGIYQLRGLDLSNMTVVEGKTGLIIIDPLLTAETAKAGLELYYQNRPRKPVVAVIYSHSHADHFGGVKGVTSEEDVAAGRVRIYAPEGFMDHAVAENIIAGNAMSRRATYQFGSLLPPSERGSVDTGLGKNLARGTLTLIAPTDTISDKTPKLTIDGVDIEFMMAPGSEAPSETMMYFPQQKVFNAAEVVTQNMHNLYTLRGAEVRDAVAWSRYIDEARLKFGDRADVMIAQHHWPTWGAERVDEMMRKQRDLYKFIHDQTVRLLNEGYKPDQIAEMVKLPESQNAEWSSHSYYGTLRHNARAIYQKYLGWYDANPAHLNPLPEVEQAKKQVAYMGGADAVIAHARKDYAAGEYRWVASVMNQVVFADPSNKAARDLGADALEQLGYQSEGGTWRGAYLMGAQELRNGVPKLPSLNTLNDDTLRALSTGLFMDYLGVRLNADKAQGKHIVLNWDFTDTKEKYVLNLENSALTYSEGRADPKADASFTLTRATLNEVILGKTTFPEVIKAGKAKVQGDPRKLGELMAMLDTFPGNFAIVEPVQPPAPAQ
ncbi:alkyl/aryl-sulfatase [Variovorax sp.]|uniref:alkyl/aryl-sulfatase n=1 Tax=Variovorax sp. TaxID=1871043 RepID=UPI002D2CFF11|nr:alkyl sulfatase dimerization domain-containing protein [Variovorax sp.]HYP81829.1 alkyl sulfatase dimerization domain-containing protein [Variovorax sp.]